jgi:hypothetical protein
MGDAAGSDVKGRKSRRERRSDWFTRPIAASCAGFHSGGRTTAVAGDRRDAAFDRRSDCARRDHSWHDTQSMIPLLPVNRVLMGKTTIEVLHRKVTLSVFSRLR